MIEGTTRGLRPTSISQRQSLMFDSRVIGLSGYLLRNSVYRAVSNGYVGFERTKIRKRNIRKDNKKQHGEVRISELDA